MNFNDIAVAIATNTQVAQYEVSICIQQMTIDEIDRLTYLVLFNNSLEKIFNIFIQQKNNDYGELICIMLQRLKIERFPSFRSTILNMVDEIQKMINDVVSNQNILQLHYLIKSLFYLLINNKEIYSHFVKSGGVVYLQKLCTLTLNYVGFTIDCEEYCQNLIPQSNQYEQNNLLYYIYLFYKQYNDEQIVMMQLYLLQNKNINTQQKIYDESIINYNLLQQQLLHNLIYTVLTETQHVVKLLQQKNLLAILSEIQQYSANNALSFFTRLVLKETMNWVYSDDVVLELCRNCQADCNLLTFYENQILQKQEVSDSIFQQTLVLLLITFKNTDYYDSSNRISTHLYSISANKFIEQVILTFLGESMHYSENCYKIFNQFLLQSIQIRQQSSLCQKICCQIIHRLLVIKQSQLQQLSQEQVNKQKQQFIKQFHKIQQGTKKLKNGVDDELIQFVSQVISQLNKQQNAIQFELKEVVEIITIYLKLIDTINVQQIIKFNIIKQLIQLGSQYQILYFSCLKQIFKCSFENLKHKDYNYLIQSRLQYNYTFKIKLSQNKILQIIPKCIGIKSEEILIQLLQLLIQTNQNDLLLFSLQCIRQSLLTNEVFIQNSEKHDKYMYKRQQFGENLINQLYLIFKKLIAQQSIIKDEYHQQYYVEQKLIDNNDNYRIQYNNLFLIYKITEEIITLVMSYVSCNAFQAQLLSTKVQNNRLVNIDKYLLILTSYLQCKLYKMDHYQFLSSVPTTLYYSNQQLIIPINNSQNIQYIDKTLTSEQKLPLIFNHFKFNICFKANDTHCNIFQISQKTQVYFGLKLQEKQDNYYNLFFTFFNLQFKSYFEMPDNQIINLEIAISVESSGSSAVQIFNKDQYFDPILKLYKNINQPLDTFQIKFTLNREKIAESYCQLPANTIILIERAIISIFSDCSYSTISIYQNNIPLFQFDNGAFYIYRLLHIPFQKQQEYNILNVSSEKCFKITQENEFINILSDQYLQEKSQIIIENNNNKIMFKQYVSASLQSQKQKSNNKISNYLQFKIINKQSMINNLSMFEYQQPLFTFSSQILNNIDNSQEKVFYPPQPLIMQNIRANLDSLQEASSINIIMTQLEKSNNLIFDLQYLSKIIYRSRKIFVHFLTNNCFKKILVIIEKYLKNNQENNKLIHLQITLMLLRIIGFNITLQKNEQLNLYVLNELGIVQDSLQQSFQDFLLLLNNSTFIQTFSTIQYHQFIKLILQKQCEFKFEYKMKLYTVVFKTEIEHMFSDIDQHYEQSLEFLKYLNQQLLLEHNFENKFENLYEKNDLNIYIFQDTNHSKIYMLSNVYNNVLIQLLEAMKYQQQKYQEHDQYQTIYLKIENEIINIIKILIYPQIATIDEILLKNNIQIQMLYLSSQLNINQIKVNWFVSLINQPILHLFNEYIQNTENIKLILKIICIIQSQSLFDFQMDDFLTKETKINYQDITFSIQPFQLKNNLFRIITSYLDSNQQITLIDEILSLCFNKYEIAISQQFTVSKFLIPKYKQQVQIINANAFYLAFQISKKNKQHFGFVINNICTIIQNQPNQQTTQNPLFLLILLEIMEYTFKNIEQEDPIISQFKQIYSKNEKQYLNQNKQFYSLIQNNKSGFTLDEPNKSQLQKTRYLKDIFSLKFLIKIINLIFQINFPYKIQLSDINQNIFSQLNVQAQVILADEANSVSKSGYLRRQSFSRKSNNYFQQQSTLHAYTIDLLISCCKEQETSLLQLICLYIITNLNCQYMSCSKIDIQDNLLSMLRIIQTTKLVFGNRVIYENNINGSLVINIYNSIYSILLGLLYHNDIEYQPVKINKDKINDQLFHNSQNVINYDLYGQFNSFEQVFSKKVDYSILSVFIQASSIILDCQVYKELDNIYFQCGPECKLCQQNNENICICKGECSEQANQNIKLMNSQILNILMQIQLQCTTFNLFNNSYQLIECVNSLMIYAKNILKKSELQNPLMQFIFKLILISSRQNINGEQLFGDDVEEFLKQNFLDIKDVKKIFDILSQIESLKVLITKENNQEKYIQQLNQLTTNNLYQRYQQFEEYMLFYSQFIKTDILRNNQITVIKSFHSLYKVMYFKKYIKINTKVTEREEPNSKSSSQTNLILTFNKNIDNIIYTIKQKLSKHFYNQKEEQQLNLQQLIETQLIMNMDQQLIDCYDHQIFKIDQQNIALQLSQRNNQQINNNYFISQSQYINGENYEKLPMCIKPMKPVTFQTQQILELFEQFQQLQVDMYYSMVLQIQANRVSFCILYDNFIYIFADSPNGKYFMQNGKQSDSCQDFQVLLESHIQETQKAYKKLNDQKKVNAELFNNTFWQPILFRINISKIISIFERDYGGILSALDIHTNEGSITSIVFTSYFEQQQFIKNILTLKPLLLRFISSIANDVGENGLLQQYPLQDYQLQNAVNKQMESRFSLYTFNLINKWLNGDLTSFKTIYELNLLSKRSINDLSQYFIFPLMFGTQNEELPLQARNLSQPVLFQGTQRLQDLVQKLEASRQFGMEEPLSAIHYSHCALPCWWGVRTEPFTSAHLLLQSCRFDASDRLFSSLYQQFGNSMFWNPQNCEEFVPEMFYDSSILYNINCYDLGSLQNGVQVSNVIVPKMSLELNNHQLYCHLLKYFFENQDQKVLLYQWMLKIFSTSGYYLKIGDSVSTVYPPISNYVQISIQEAEQSLNLFMKKANEQNAHSTVMKLIYFGRQPQTVFSNQLKQYLTTEKNPAENQLIQELFKKFYTQALEQMEQINNNTENIQNNQMTIQYISSKKYQIQYTPDNIVPVLDLYPQYTIFQKNQYHKQKFVLNPGQLSGRSQYMMNYSVAGKWSKLDSTLFDYRLHKTNSEALENSISEQFSNSIQNKYQNINQYNSLLIDKVYMIPDGLMYMQVPGNETDYCCCYDKEIKIIKVYKLPQVQLYDQIYVGETTCIQVGCSNFLQLDGTNDIFVARKYGVIDVYNYDCITRKSQNIMYFYIGESQIDNMFYNQSWSLLFVVSQNKLFVICVIHMQKLFEIEVNDVLDIRASSEKPLLFILERGKVRIINFRTMQEIQSINEGYRCLCYNDSQDILYLAKNSLIFKVINVFKLSISHKIWSIMCVGSIDEEDIGPSQIQQMWLVQNDLWLYVLKDEKLLLKVDIDKK